MTLPGERDFADVIKPGIWRAGKYLGLSWCVTVNMGTLKTKEGGTEWFDERIALGLALCLLKIEGGNPGVAEHSCNLSTG